MVMAQARASVDRILVTCRPSGPLVPKAPSPWEGEKYSPTRYPPPKLPRLMTIVIVTDGNTDHASFISASWETLRGVKSILGLQGYSMGTRDGTRKNAERVNDGIQIGKCSMGFIHI